MIGVGIQSQMRRELFEHLESLPFSFFDDHETGRIMSRMTNDLFEVCELAHHGPENILTGGIMIVLSFMYLSSINITLTLIIFSCVPLLIVVSFYSRRNMKRAFADRRVSTAEINAATESSISGIRVTKAVSYTHLDVYKRQTLHSQHD